MLEDKKNVVAKAFQNKKAVRYLVNIVNGFLLVLDLAMLYIAYQGYSEGDYLLAFLSSWGAYFVAVLANRLTKEILK